VGTQNSGNQQNPTGFEMSPAQRAFAAAAASVQDGFVRALDRAVVARQKVKIAQDELNVAVAELRTYRGEIDDQVAA
jgi:hypothetical protein